MLEVRPAVPGDAVGIAGVFAATMPYLVKTARGIAVELRSAKSRVVLVAADEDRIVGYGNIYLPLPGTTNLRVRVTVQVPPADRGRGAGSLLTEEVTRVATEAGATSLLVVVADEPESKAFAARRGFTITRQMSHSRAELADAPAPAAVPEGLRLVSFDEVTPRQVWDASRAVADDDPSGLSRMAEYDVWVPTEWEHPDLRKDLSIALLDGDQVVSFVTTTGDPDRRVLWSNLTGTVPAYRGRGLAKVVKSHALDRGRAAGFEAAYTGNDADNRPMLAVNQWLGYRVSGAAWTAERTLG